MLHYIVETIHLNKVKKQAFRPSSTSPTSPLQCSPKTSPSLSIWDTCPWRGASSSQLPSSWQGKSGYFSLECSNYVPSPRFVKTWLITALVNFHAMRGDMADEARDSISSEEVRTLQSLACILQLEKFRSQKFSTTSDTGEKVFNNFQHCWRKSCQAGDSWSLGQRDASCDQREPCPFQRGHCNTGAEGFSTIV